MYTARASEGRGGHAPARILDPAVGTNGEIAQRIGRTEETVKVHVKNILRKLNAQDLTVAAR